MSIIPYHQNVIKHYANIGIYYEEDAEFTDCLGWITIMEKCDSNLRELLKKELLNIEERREIAVGIMNGYKYLKDIGINHHDLKPENVLLSEGVCKIIDFGTVDCVNSKYYGWSGREFFQLMGYARIGNQFASEENLSK